jgi:hypothetical protein
MSDVARSLAYIRFGNLVKMSFHGVQMLSPSAKLRAIEKTVFQMMYQRYVSRKKSTRSMTNMIASVNAAWFWHSAAPKILSSQPWIVIPTIAAIGFEKDCVRKK